MGVSQTARRANQTTLECELKAELGVEMRSGQRTFDNGAALGDRYRLRDLLLVPAWLSLARIPLAVCFALVVKRPALAMLVLALAALTDVLDGWVARRSGTVTRTGAALDPITDKVFVLTVAIALVMSGRLSLLGVALLSTREIGELGLTLWSAVQHVSHAARSEALAANQFGKFATVLQFVAVCWALLQLPYLACWLVAAAVSGVVAAVSYWRREIRIERREALGSGR
jgi:CDP-diacylglycerol--glycerol-3-phosphate 3-phosphatidyltransferase/cardiolipin synthase